MYAVHKHEKIDAVRKTKLNITDALLVKYLLGELPGNEMSGVAYAISAHSEVRKQFEQLQLIWNECDTAGVKSSANVDEAWQRFRQGIGTRQNNRRAFSLQPYNKWLRVAAMLLLLASGCLVSYTLINNREVKTVAVVTQPVSTSHSTPIVKSVAKVEPKNVLVQASDNKKPGEPQHKRSLNDLVPVNRSTAVNAGNKKEIVCNSTPCPLEICIIQRLKCKDGQSSTVATCSKLAPDESNRLLYKTFNKTTSTCSATIDEITIKKVATGETMIFNQDSKPVTAGELFSYISGQKKGDILAGTFDSDCLAFDSKSGDFVLQQCAPGNNDNCD